MVCHVCNFRMYVTKMQDFAPKKKQHRRTCKDVAGIYRDPVPRQAGQKTPLAILKKWAKEYGQQ